MPLPSLTSGLGNQNVIADTPRAAFEGPRLSQSHKSAVAQYGNAIVNRERKAARELDKESQRAENAFTNAVKDKMAADKAAATKQLSLLTNTALKQLELSYAGYYDQAIRENPTDVIGATTGAIAKIKSEDSYTNYVASMPEYKQRAEQRFLGYQTESIKNQTAADAVVYDDIFDKVVAIDSARVSSLALHTVPEEWTGYAMKLLVELSIDYLAEGDKLGSKKDNRWYEENDKLVSSIVLRAPDRLFATAAATFLSKRYSPSDRITLLNSRPKTSIFETYKKNAALAAQAARNEKRAKKYK